MRFDQYLYITQAHVYQVLKQLFKCFHLLIPERALQFLDDRREVDLYGFLLFIINHIIILVFCILHFNVWVSLVMREGVHILLLLIDLWCLGHLRLLLLKLLKLRLCRSIIVIIIIYHPVLLDGDILTLLLRACIFNSNRWLYFLGLVPHWCLC